MLGRQYAKKRTKVTTQLHLAELKSMISQGPENPLTDGKKPLPWTKRN